MSRWKKLFTTLRSYTGLLCISHQTAHTQIYIYLPLITITMQHKVNFFLAEFNRFELRASFFLDRLSCHNCRAQSALLFTMAWGRLIEIITYFNVKSKPIFPGFELVSPCPMMVITPWTPLLYSEYIGIILCLKMRSMQFISDMNYIIFLFQSFNYTQSFIWSFW